MQQTLGVLHHSPISRSAPLPGIESGSKLLASASSLILAIADQGRLSLQSLKGDNHVDVPDHDPPREVSDRSVHSLMLQDDTIST
jgi:hypothetical protein